MANKPNNSKTSNYKNFKEMEKLHKLTSSNSPFSFMLLVSIFATAFAWIAEYYFELLPCKLCLYQRYPYYVAFFVCVMMLNYEYKPKVRNNVLLLLGILGVLTFIIAFYQYLVETGVFEGTDSCTASLNLGNGNVLEMIENNPIASCQAASWKIFGVSASLLHAIFAVLWSDVLLLSYIVNTRLGKVENGKYFKK